MKEAIRQIMDSPLISYSEFFRNPLTYAVLEQLILPELICKKQKNNRKELRAWSAACASGQEPYSLAILMEELLSRVDGVIPFRIFATDQNCEQINNAKKGKYDACELHNMNLLRLNQWFNVTHGKYAIAPALKKHIDFSVFDLFNNDLSCPPASIFGDFDLVCCANILFYYNQQHQQKVIEKVVPCLANGGYLITGEVEREIMIRQHFQEVYPHAAIFQCHMD